MLLFRSASVAVAKKKKKKSLQQAAAGAVLSLEVPRNWSVSLGFLICGFSFVNTDQWMTLQFFSSEVFQGHEKLAFVTARLICYGKTVICLGFTTGLSAKSPELEKFALCEVNFVLSTQTLNNRYDRFIKQISKTPRAVTSISHKKNLKSATCQTEQVRYCNSKKNKLLFCLQAFISG